MRRIPNTQKTELGEKIASWYRGFGKVSARRAYHDDDESGTGAAGAAPPWEAHPLFMDVPLGAPSDLASILVDDERTLDAAKDREKESCPELKNQLTNTLKQRYDLNARAKPLPKLQAY